MSNKEDETLLMGGQNAASQEAVGMAAGFPPKAKLICLDDSLLQDEQKGLQILLEKEDQTIGRSADNTAPIDYAKISRFHARIYPSMGKWAIEDLNSANGTWINEVRVRDGVLQSGDHVRIGAIPFLFNYARPGRINAADLSREREDEGDDGDDGDSEKTMFVGGMGMANDRIVEALADNRQDRETPRDETDDDEGSFERHPLRESPRKSSGGWKTALISLFVVIALGVAGYVVYPMFMAPDGKEAFVASRGKVETFFNEYEIDKGAFDGDSLQVQLEQLAGLRSDLERDVQLYPANLRIRKLLARVIFLQAERQVAQAIVRKDVASSILPLDDALRRVEALAVEEDTEGLKDKLQEVQDALSFAQVVVSIKRVKQKYPDLVNLPPLPPGDRSLENYAQDRRTFIDKKKSASMNIILTVRFPFFGKIADQVDEVDLPYLDRWYELMQR